MGFSFILLLKNPTFVRFLRRNIGIKDDIFFEKEKSHLYTRKTTPHCAIMKPSEALIISIERDE
ncbi:hypothetical protein HR15_00560 [Porphyromonas gulae]|uniref:Uncharacterized protein n=1 Tax=Porphyromonas gulae TaxID=111105 RepID=A0A0A2FU82_9PORP|nr:hypothetical protein HR15_00560 [Porphyromonas gulae]